MTDKTATGFFGACVNRCLYLHPVEVTLSLMSPCIVGHSGGGLYAHGPVQPAPPAQPAQPLLRPCGECPRTGGQGATTERHGER